MLTRKQPRPVEPAHWLVVGTRPDGSQLVLAQFLREADAEDIAGVYRRHLTGVSRIEVERCTATGR